MSFGVSHNNEKYLQKKKKAGNLEIGNWLWTSLRLVSKPQEIC